MSLRPETNLPFQGRKYHFSGVGGSGMTPLALLSVSLGAEVTGSDRNLDRGLELPAFDALRRAGVRFVPQDGSGVVPGLDAFIHSTAVETSNPDFARALALDVPRIRRGSFLASVASTRRTIAIAGTSGKSTVTAMVAHLLTAAGLDPSFLGGAAAVDLPGALPPGSLRLGSSDWFVVETDESDGSVAEVASAIAVLTNLSRDHKEVEETTRLFETLLAKTRECAVLHCGDPSLQRVRIPEGLSRVCVTLEGSPSWSSPDLTARSIRLEPGSVAFDLNGIEVTVPVPGRLTVENALLALGAAEAAGVPLAIAAEALSSFPGVRRRLERVGSVAGIDVFDDFAHNPVKIAAALEALRPRGSLWIYYQPHGYGPTRFFKDELIATFGAGLRQGDRLLLAPIYDAGGTADRSIRSEDVARPLRESGVNAAVAPTREEAARIIAEGARAGDRVVVMGARDDTLPAFARQILAAILDHAAPAPTPQARQ
jgi:UDP-N-acetylmuramate--alanine ligase